ncbi:MAG: prepilin-type N-terminal cleavage/methylation domain-containing protein [Desulfosalsimonadaceae bacterium]
MRSGFTLIELLVVLLLIALISAFVAPRVIAPFGGLHLKTASKKIVSALRYARSQAVSQKEGRVAIFDFEKRRFMVFRGSSLPPEYRAEDLPLKKAEMLYDLPEKVRFQKAVSGDESVSRGLFQVAFYTNGSSKGAEIFLEGDSGLRYRIEVDFITGMASLDTVEKQSF